MISKGSFSIRCLECGAYVQATNSGVSYVSNCICCYEIAKELERQHYLEKGK